MSHKHCPWCGTVTELQAPVPWHHHPIFGLAVGALLGLLFLALLTFTNPSRASFITWATRYVYHQEQRSAPAEEDAALTAYFDANLRTQNYLAFSVFTILEPGGEPGIEVLGVAQNFFVVRTPPRR